MTIKSRPGSVPGLADAYASLKRIYHAGISLRSPGIWMFPAGHFYSPIPDPRTVITERNGLPKDTLSCPGVKLNSAGQLKVLEELSEHYSDLPFSDSPAEALRYYFDNPYFRHGDGIVLYGMLRRLRPSQVIEIGSGFSSALMLDIADHSPDWNPHFTFVEPYPARLRGLLTAEDEARF
jgi:hypothetical protein